MDTGTERVPVRLVDGRVSVDRGRVWRREFTGTLAPDTDRALLQPRGHRLRCRMGVQAPDGRTFWAPLIVGRLGGYSRGFGGGFSVSAKSLEYEVERARFLSPRTIESSSGVDAVRALVVEAVPDAYFASTVTTDAPVPRVVHDSDRWRAIDGSDESICRANGWELACDGDGTFVLADVPTVSADASWSAREGQALVDWREEASEDDVVNVVVCTGERVDGGGPIPYGLWWDSNPYSPTYVGDVASSLLSGAVTLEQLLAESLPTAVRGFGVAPYFLASPVVTTDQQAAAAAATLGRSRVGLLRHVSFDSVVNPWASAGDVVDVDIGGRTERHLIESLTIDLVGGAMSCDTRAVPL